MTQIMGPPWKKKVVNMAMVIGGSGRKLNAQSSKLNSGSKVPLQIGAVQLFRLLARRFCAPVWSLALGAGLEL
jgi:hypothetical protein